MSKSKGKRKTQELQTGTAAKKAKLAVVTPPTDLTDAKTIGSIGLEEADLEITVDTLNSLAQQPSVMKSKACKGLRTAVYDFRQACTTGLSAGGDSNLTARISGALADELYIEARVMLSEMRIRGKTPKLGALCRWVRDLDVVSGLAEQLDSSGRSRTAKEKELLVVLDAILRVTGPTDYSMEGSITEGPINPRNPWDLRSATERVSSYESVLNRSIFSCLPDGLKENFRVIETTPGLDRKPANLHPAILHASKDDTIALSPDISKAAHHKHPVVPNLHLIKDVLTPTECAQIIAAGETIGFTPDAPIRSESGENSILAHNFYWVVDNAFNDKLWNRVKDFVPKVVKGKKVRGINRRFRVYRYVPGAEYRAHIDGAWPPSSIDPSTDRYIYDASPPGAKQSSLFTFLIYLNDEFEAGETSYFLPSAKEGTMNAYSIKPIQGSVAMFPHGETEGSLLHEGTGVRQDRKLSAKYVIRTDVLYDVDVTP
ncbi:hypothetical protein BJ878DRAFT_323353 [Calycina marina]|uniref:Fe2OG dioxygenase domain-containing protein n=1 Tax=Calycina marina TaxID=1763456 RepID=A0A9P8CG72_9HELO|nr:hypothetical protein BJ878DRAFT_323353 [Calycina marina]